MIFQNRQQAGKLLGEKLRGIKERKVRKGAVVLGIPRGGVVVAAEVARVLGEPLDVLIVKKIGAPGNEELAVGAMGQDGQPVWNRPLLSSLQLTLEDLDEEVQSSTHSTGSGLMLSKVEASKFKVQSYSKKFKVKKMGLKGKTVLVVDDGIATGATAKAALLYLDTKIQRYKDTKIVLATPVIAADTVAKLKPLCDQLVYLEAPTDFWAVGQFYREFPQVEDEEVIKIISNF